MPKFRIHFPLTLCFIILCAGLAGCAEEPQAISQVEMNESLSKYTNDAIDYNQYIKKIWVVKDWHGGLYRYPSSFRITKIENEAIEGQLSTHAVAYPPSYMDLPMPTYFPKKYTPNLYGTINHGAAECQFSGEDGDKGTISLIFKEDNTIEAEIEYEKVAYCGIAMDKERYYEKLWDIYKSTQENREIYKKLPPMDGKYIFRPLNLADYEASRYPGERLDPLKTHSFETDLDYWGKVNFVTGVFDGNKPYPVAYLTNEHNDILYSFGVPFQVGTEIIDVLIEDMNGDSIKDVKFFSDFSPPVYDEHITWIYFQMDDGIFYDSQLGDRDPEH